MEQILIVDDVPRVRELLADHLDGEECTVLQAGDGAEALRLVKEHELNLVLLDLGLPDMSGIDVLKEIVTLRPALPVVIVSGEGTIRTAVEATRLGAYDFLEKPVERERLLIAVRRALERDRMQREVALLKEEAWRKYRMVGVTEPMQAIFRRIEEVAPARVSVLITGESGGGKELVARAIHYKSNRRDRVFVKLNCAAIPETLFESELFGYEKGAFTGALNQKKGKLELADQGTLFLDEVGDLSPASQAKLLRFLQESEFERLGGTQTLKVDVRVVAATNKDLKDEIKAGNFREDLYYRLNGVPIPVPPLRERKDDIPILADHFLQVQCEENGVPVKHFSLPAMQYLKNAAWPGNVRELENIVKRAALLVKGQEITPRDLPELMEPGARKPGAAKRTLREARAEFERELILEALARNNWDKTRTAEELDIERAHLYRKLADLGISEA